MANSDYLIAGNDEHGLEPLPTIGKRTPYISQVGRSFYENEFNNFVSTFNAPSRKGRQDIACSVPGSQENHQPGCSFFKSSLNSTFYLIDVKKRLLLQKSLLKKFNTSPILYRLLFMHTNLYNFSVTHHS